MFTWCSQPDMVAERLVLPADLARGGSVEDGRPTAMAAGQLLEFPGWSELQAMPAEDLKPWLFSKSFEPAQYVAMVSEASVATHRGHGAVLPERERAPRPQQPQGDAGDEGHEKSYEDLRI